MVASGGDLIKTIAEMSVECARHLKDEYPQELVEAFSMVGKYLLLATLRKEDRKDCSPASNATMCPLCELHLNVNGSCGNCVLAEDVKDKQCGRLYNDLKATLENGTYMDVAFQLGVIIKEIMDCYR
jgi:hypothetical protein